MNTYGKKFLHHLSSNFFRVQSKFVFKKLVEYLKKSRVEIVGCYKKSTYHNRQTISWYDDHKFPHQVNFKE